MRACYGVVLCVLAWTSAVAWTSAEAVGPPIDFLEAALERQYDDDYYSQYHFEPATRLAFTRLRGKDITRDPIVLTLAEDSIAEMFRLMINENLTVAANSAADGKYIGGIFTTQREFSTGDLGTQEQGLMAVFDGLLESLLHFAVRHSDGRLARRRTDRGRLIYLPHTFSGTILFSKGVRLSIDHRLWDRFDKHTGHRGFFTSFIARMHYQGRSVWSQFESLDKTMDVYSIAGLEKGPRTAVEYRRLERATYRQISTMLQHAQEQGTEAVVVTVPGSGGLAHYRGDPRYLATVRRATLDAVADHGRGFREVVVCGCEARDRVVTSSREGDRQAHVVFNRHRGDGRENDEWRAR